MTMGTLMTQPALRQLVPAVLLSIVLVVPLTAQEFSTGDPIGATNEAGVWQPMSAYTHQSGLGLLATD